MLLLVALLFQNGNAQQIWGIQAGNTLSLPRGTPSELLVDGVVLRNSIGIFARTRIVDNLKAMIIAPTRKGVIELDYGFNAVMTGYEYRFGEIGLAGDQVSLELPLLLNLYDERNVFMPRRLLRKGINTFVRIGLKPSLTLPDRYENMIVENDERVRENFSVRPFNLLGSYSFGLMRRMKNGNVALFEVSVNMGLLPKIEGEINYQPGAGLSDERVYYQDNGSYIAMNVAYLWRRGKRTRSAKPARLPPVIYHPRYQ